MQDALTAQQELVEVTRVMLDGSLHYLEGSVIILGLRELLGIYENDPDFFAFVGVMAEINNLDVDFTQKGWAGSLSAEKEKEVQSSVEWARNITKVNCQSLFDRYS